MNLEGKSILIQLGGMWHNFDGFANIMAPVFEADGYQVEATYDLDALTRLDQSNVDLLLSYTCMTAHRPGMDDRGPQGMTIEQVTGLCDWVRSGGGLLAAHAATVIGDSDPRLGRLLGGVFLSHPEPFSFTLTPLSGEHSITAGIPAFAIHDEFYIQEYDPAVHIHMVATYQDVAYPMVWSRREGLGRVAVVSPGHFPPVWQDPAYQRLMLQAAGWLVEER